MNSFKKDYEIKLSLHINVTHYKPGREAPACSNPSSPLFSDPGDDEEFEFVLTLYDSETGVKKELPEELDFLYDQLYDEIYSDYIDGIDYDYPF